MVASALDPDPSLNLDSVCCVDQGGLKFPLKTENLKKICF